MRSSAAKLCATLAVSFLGLGQVGCLKQMILDGQIASTRKASARVNTFSDFEVANAGAFAGLAQFEGMHYLAPENQDGLFMLTRGWAAAGFAFIEDAMERAAIDEGEDSEAFRYHKQRARAAYDRAIFYGSALLESMEPGFKEAQHNDATMREYLLAFEDAEDAEPLFWTGYAWMAKTNIAKSEPPVVAQLFVGVALMERSVELDETYNAASGHVALAAYHARTALAELDDAKQHFDRAVELSEGKALLAKVQYAARYQCLKGDKEGYVKTLEGVLAAQDPWPEQRLPNTLAKRKAQRYLTDHYMKKCGF